MKAPMAKNNTWQNTTKYTSRGTKASLSWLQFVCLLYLCFQRERKKELPDQIAKVVCYVLVCYNCVNQHKRTLNNKHFLCSFFLSFYFSISSSH